MAECSTGFLGLIKGTIQDFGGVKYLFRSTSITEVTLGARATAFAAFCGTSDLGKAFIVTTTFAFVSLRIAPICSASKRGFMGFAIPAIAPPKRVKTVSFAFGNM